MVIFLRKVWVTWLNIAKNIAKKMGECRLANYRYFSCFNNSSTYAAGAGREAEISAISISSQPRFWATADSCFGLWVVFLWKTTCWAFPVLLTDILPMALGAGESSGGASSIPAHTHMAGTRGMLPGHCSARVAGTQGDCGGDQGI